MQEWLACDISILDRGLLVIGREVATDFGGYIDLLCIDVHGDVVMIELKRDKTPREITAQVLDYGSWIVDLSNERVSSIAQAYLGEGGLESAFRKRFGTDIPETLNADHRMLIVGSHIDSSSERIIRYLSNSHGVNINAATFQYFKESDGMELVARVFLMEPNQVDLHTRSKGTSKRRPPLTYAELEALADESGVVELYRYAVDSIDGLLQKITTRSSIVFNAVFNGSRNAVFSLLPGSSSAARGLKFQLYRNRFAQLAGLDPVEVAGLMPEDIKDWIYYETAGSDYEGFQGFIRSLEDVDRLSDALRGQHEGHKTMP